MNHQLNQQLLLVRRRMFLLRFWTGAFALLVLATLVMLLFWKLSSDIPWDFWQGIFVSASLIVGSIAASFLYAAATRKSLRQVAINIESARPSLGQLLLSALDQKPDASGHLSYLQQRVIQSAIHHSETEHWYETIPSARIKMARWATIASALLVLVFTLGISRGGFITSRDPSLDNLTSIELTFEVQPGNVEIESGTSLVVTAKYLGTRIPTEVLLDYSNTQGEYHQPMTRNLDDPIFASYILGVRQDLRYRVRAGDRITQEYQVRVFEYPQLVRSDAEVLPPTYTGIEPKRIEDTVRVTVVEGTDLSWSLLLNKPNIVATLIELSGEELPLKVDPGNPLQHNVRQVVVTNKRWKLKLVDDSGRENKEPIELVARVLPNRPAELKLVTATDAIVSPLEELPVAADVADDFGVRRAGITYTMGQLPSKDIEIVSQSGESPLKKVFKNVRYTVEFEQLKAEPDQLLSYHFWAEDVGPNGQVRRTKSDIFFAEVRPFEQIFREGTPPPANSSQQPPSTAQQQQAQQAEELAELQKQIVSALWNLIRRADIAGDVGDDSLQPQFVEDANTILESQQQAIQQLQVLIENLPEDRSPELVEAVGGYMELAAQHLEQSVTGMTRAPLEPAIVSARAAYEAMLKLRAREFDVVQQQQQQQQSGSAGRSQMQRQLDQLELENDPNRYETEQQANDNAESNADQQVRDALSRLRDLARRQSDLNEQLKSLELALQKASTDEEKEAAQRQLQRLREQQQELLRDADELASDLKENAQDASFDEASKKLEETRQNLRDADQALEKGEPSEALAAGSRAERSLDTLEDEFKQSTSDSLAEAVKSIRDKASELEREQQELIDKLSRTNDPVEGAGLRPSEDGRGELAERFSQQEARTGELLDELRETIRQAEENQPLLANALYEAERRAQQANIEEDLALAGELLKRGYDPQAEQAASASQEKIEQLNQDIESAAKNLLGDPTEALQRANDKLEELANRLAGERSNAGKSSNNPEDGQQQDGQQPDGQLPGGQQPDGQQPDGQQPGGQQPGEKQPDGQQPDGQQPGGQQPGEQQPDGQQPGGQQPGGQQPGEQQPGGQQPGEQQPGEQQPGGQQPGGQQPGGQQPGGQQGVGGNGGGLLDGLWADPVSADGGEDALPITGDGFRDWSEELREVEDLLDDDELRSRAAGIRDRARELRREVTRHSHVPQWAEIEEMISKPLQELRRDVAGELLRRSAEKNAIVPLERDPVPSQFEDAVRKYYEQLGTGF